MILNKITATNGEKSTNLVSNPNFFRSSLHGDKIGSVISYINLVMALSAIGKKDKNILITMKISIMSNNIFSALYKVSIILPFQLFILPRKKSLAPYFVLYITIYFNIIWSHNKNILCYLLNISF